jgi:hypothetical protein
VDLALYPSIRDFVPVGVKSRLVPGVVLKGLAFAPVDLVFFSHRALVVITVITTPLLGRTLGGGTPTGRLGALIHPHVLCTRSNMVVRVLRAGSKVRVGINIRNRVPRIGNHERVRVRGRRGNSRALFSLS